jgi:hypothetical protein
VSLPLDRTTFQIRSESTGIIYPYRAQKEKLTSPILQAFLKRLLSRLLAASEILNH